MDFKLLATILGLEELTFKSRILGGDPYLQLTEEQVSIIENALGKTGNAELKNKVESLESTIVELETENANVKKAVTTALELNQLEAGTSEVDSIALLGNTCKEYGEKKMAHTLTPRKNKETDIEGDLIEGYFDPNDEHNKID